MKKLFLSVIALFVAIGVNAQRWDFTNWSAETVANLKAANVSGTEWSDIEKAGGTAADIAKENCFWEVTAHGSEEGSPMTIGGEPVKELEGLLFIHTKDRSLAIAVNYGDCTSLNGNGFGPYHGPQYLWFGGKNLNYIVIPKVKPGTEIKIGVESHKVTDARGLQLFVGRGNSGTQLKDIEGNDVGYPKTYEDLSWYVPTDLTDTPNEDGTFDITLRNNNGCHLYYIQVGDDTGKSYTAGYLYAGETAAEELPLYNAVKGLENLTLNAINVDAALPTKEELMAYDAVVLDGSLPADNAALVGLLKENLYWQPVFNVNAPLAEALGLGSVIDLEMELGWAYDAKDRVFVGMEEYYVDSVKFAMTNGEVMPVAMKVTGQQNIDRLVTSCSMEEYEVYADTVIAYIYNSGHNQYTYYGVSGDYAEGTDVLVSNLFAQTLYSKADVTPAFKPSFASEYKHLETVVSISGSNRNPVIYYTTDGTDPILGVSPVYTEPITVSTEGVTIKAIAISDGYLVSEVASIEVPLYNQAQQPVISYEGNGMTENAVITITSPEEGVEIWYNFTESNDKKLSTKYDGPITLPISATISAFAVSDTLGLISSELVSTQILANVDKIRRDELAHFQVNNAGWNTLENLTLDGEPMTAWVSNNYYFSWGKTPTQSYETVGDPKTDENGDFIVDENGNFIYETQDKPLSVTLNAADPDWRLVSRGQVMIYQSNTLGGNVGDGSGYNPERAEDYLEQLGTKGDIQMAGIASGDKPTAAIESTKKFAGPFNVVSIIANVGSGGLMVVETSKDGVAWELLGDTLQTATVKRLYKKFEVAYEGTDEVYVRVASAKNSSQAVHDIYVFNQGEKSAAMRDELVSGIKETLAPETVVVKPVKKILNGQFVIVVGDRVYSVSGARLK